MGADGQAEQRAIVGAGRGMIAAGIAALALVTVHIWVALHLPDKGPIILLDEGGYLGNATRMAHGFGQPLAGYYGGYSLLLVPAAVLRSDPRGFYEAALITNAVLSLVTAALAFLLARRLFPNLRAGAGVLVAATVVLQPLVFADAHVAMSENAMVPTTLLAALLLSSYVDHRSVASGVGAAVAASFAFWISPRGALVIAAFALALAFLWLQSRERLAGIVPMTVALGAAIAISVVFNKALRGSHPVPGVEGVSQLPSFGRASTWRNVLASIAGRFAYIGLATFTLAIVGLAVTVVWVARRRAPNDTPVSAPAVVGIFAAIPVVLTVLSSAVSMHVNRIDVLYYGRYIEAVAMPLVVIGAGWLVSLTAQQARHLVPRIAAGATGASLMFILLARLFPEPPPTYTEVPINVAAVFSIRHVLHLSGYTGPLLVGALAAGALLLVAAIDARLTLVAILVVFGLAGSSMYRDFERPFSEQRRQTEHVAHSIAELERLGVTTRCLSYDKSAAASWALGDDVFLLPRWKFVPSGPRTAAACRSLLLSALPPSSDGDWTEVSSDRVYITEADLWINLSDFAPSMRTRLAAVR